MKRKNQKMIDYESRLKEAKEMLKVQKDSYDYDEYMHGMYNGMEFVLCLMEDREPEYMEAPEKWTRDNEDQIKPKESNEI